AAIDFGIISANKIILTVKIIVSTVKFKPYSIAILVRSTGMTRIAILFPIKIVVINSLGLDSKLDNLFDCKSPAFAALLTLKRFAAVNASSLPKTNSDTKNNIKMTIIIIIVVDSSFVLIIILQKSTNENKIIEIKIDGVSSLSYGG